MSTQRGNRGALVRVSLVGYTNVGKSTLMNAVAKSEVFAEDKLFATLDTTVRKVVIQNLPFLLTDTVGFIRKLPTQLVESFKSTLDEVRESDLLLHVVDIAHESFEDHIAAVEKILEEIKASNKPTIMVFNKIDAYKPQEINEDDEDFLEHNSKAFTLEEWQQTWMSKLGNDVLFISATEKQGMDEFRKKVYEKVREIHVQRFPYNSLLYPDWNEEEE
jgi:GTP-binding protein HflX